MATAATIKKNIAKLEAALKSKATPKSLKPKLETQLVKSKAELSGMNKGTKPKTSSTKSTQTALQKLKAMVNKNKKYKTYKGAGVDLEKDADRPALRTGKRVTDGTHYPYKKGNVYYEYRANRIDVKQPPKKYPKLEKGGYMADGGMIYKMADNMTDAEYEKKFSGLNEKQKKTYESLVRLGDSPKLALATTLLSNEVKYSEDTTRAYTMAEGGEIDYSKQTSDDFKLGEIVWDTDNKRYGTIIGIYDKYASDKYEVRLDSDGMQPTENLRKVGSKGDKGTKEQLKEAIEDYARLVKSYPKNNYPQQRKEFVGQYAEGGELSGLIANIYRSDYDSPTNKMYGKSNVTIIDKEVSEIFKANESRPAVRLVRRKFRFGSDEYEYIHAVPYDQSDNEGMFGGTFIYSSDSRFPSKYPIPLHDRVESYKKGEDLEKGGYMAKGGISDKEVAESNAEMVLSQIKAVKHHAQELSNVVSKNSDIEAWVVAKIERASTDLSDITHYLEFQTNKMAMGGEIHRTQD